MAPAKGKRQRFVLRVDGSPQKVTVLPEALLLRGQTQTAKGTRRVRKPPLGANAARHGLPAPRRAPARPAIPCLAQSPEILLA